MFNTHAIVIIRCLVAFHLVLFPLINLSRNIWILSRSTNKLFLSITITEFSTNTWKFEILTEDFKKKVWSWGEAAEKVNSGNDWEKCAGGCLQNIIKVAEYRGDDLSKILWRNIVDKSLQNMKDEIREPEKLELSIKDASNMQKACRKKASNNQFEKRGEQDKLELSIPRTNDGHLNRRKPCTVYCRNHNSFARY